MARTPYFLTAASEISDASTVSYSSYQVAHFIVANGGPDPDVSVADLSCFHHLLHPARGWQGSGPLPFILGSRERKSGMTPRAWGY